MRANRLHLRQRLVLRLLLTIGAAQEIKADAVRAAPVTEKRAHGVEQQPPAVRKLHNVRNTAVQKRPCRLLFLRRPDHSDRARSRRNGDPPRHGLRIEHAVDFTDWLIILRRQPMARQFFLHHFLRNVSSRQKLLEIKSFQHFVQTVAQHFRRAARPAKILFWTTRRRKRTRLMADFTDDFACGGVNRKHFAFRPAAVDGENDSPVRHNLLDSVFSSHPLTQLIK